MSHNKIIPGPYSEAQRIWIHEQAESYIGHTVGEGWIEVMIENMEDGMYATLDEAFAQLYEVLLDNEEEDES